MAMNIRLILFIIRWKENGEGSIMWELRQVEHSLLNFHSWKSEKKTMYSLTINMYNLGRDWNLAGSRSPINVVRIEHTSSFSSKLILNDKGWIKKNLKYSLAGA